MSIGKDWYKTSHRIDLPSGYGFGNGNCHFHTYHNHVWAVVQSSSEPAEALEVDVDHGKVITALGAGHLKTPNAAYYGKGFAP